MAIVLYAAAALFIPWYTLCGMAIWSTTHKNTKGQTDRNREGRQDRPLLFLFLFLFLCVT